MMRRTWRRQVDKERTLETYTKAVNDGAVELAARLIVANPRLLSRFNIGELTQL